MSSQHDARPAIDRRSAVLNVLANWGGLVLTAAIAFLLTPYIVHSLGDVQYGIWALLGSIVAYFGLLDVGVRSAVTRSVASRHAGARHDDAGRELAAALTVFTVAAVAAIGVSALIATFGLEAFEIPASLEPAARRVLLLGGMTTAVSMIGGVFGGVIVGRQRFDVLVAIEMSATVVRALAVVALLAAGHGIVALALVQAGVAMLTGLAHFFTSRRLYPDLTVGLRGWSWTDLRHITSFGLSAWLIHLGAIFTRHSDALVIGAFLPVAQVTFYVIAATLTDYMRLIVSGISQTLTPMASHLDGSDRSADAPLLILRAARYANLVAAPILITLALRGDSFIALWMGEAYREPAGAVLLILTAARWSSIGFQVCNSTLMGLDQHRRIVPALLGEAAVNVALSILLVGPLGIVGVALGTLLPRVLISLVVGPFYARARIGLPVGRFLYQSMLRPAAAMIPFALASVATEVAWPARHLLLYLAQIALALPLAAAGGWWLGLDRAERSILSAALRARVRGRAGVG